MQAVAKVKSDEARAGVPSLDEPSLLEPPSPSFDHNPDSEFSDWKLPPSSRVELDDDT